MSASPTNPPLVPDHELLRCIGRGSYGEVWLARNVMGSFRAVKVVYRASFENERPFEREFSGLQQFEPVSRTHPGLVSVLHIGRNAAEGYFYSVMEVADDAVTGPAIEPNSYRPRTLASEIAQRGRLPLAECVRSGIALAAALDHLHSRGLVHRDIKPSNIIFVNGAPKFADIGLVTQIGAKATFVGTDGYLPPEGSGAPEADVYGLGKLLYEISMGKNPEQFPELPTRLRELPEAPGLMRLNAILLKACEPQPAKRFRSARELEQALAELDLDGGDPKRAVAGRADAARVVILSPSAVSEVASLTAALGARLDAEGLQVRVEDSSVLSVEWARGMEQELGFADVVIAILSPASVHSEMMAYSLEIARQSERSPRLVALSVEMTTPLSRPLALALEGSDMIEMTSTADADRTIGEVATIVSAPRIMKKS